MNASNDWEDLIQKHLDGRNSVEEGRALSDEIVANPSVRQQYLLAAQLHAALADETLLDAEALTPASPAPHRTERPLAGSFVWPRQMTAGILAGCLLGFFGMGVVWAMNAPKTITSPCSLAHGDFNALPPGPIPNHFPLAYGMWSGDPAEVVEQADGNRALRFLETANIAKTPNGLAVACDVFQLIDLRPLIAAQDLSTDGSRVTLELSATFHRDHSNPDSSEQMNKGVCRLYLFDAEPASIGKDWPGLAREALTSAGKGIHLAPGGAVQRVSASCLLPPEATLGVIQLAINPKHTTRATPIGDCFVDDIQLTITRHPQLPVKTIKIASQSIQP